MKTLFLGFFKKETSSLFSVHKKSEHSARFELMRKHSCYSPLHKAFIGHIFICKSHGVDDVKNVLAMLPFALHRRKFCTLNVCHNNNNTLSSSKFIAEQHVTVAYKHLGMKKYEKM